MKKRTPIKIRLYAEGITQGFIAEQTSLCLRTVMRTVNYEDHNQSVQEFVAKVIGVPAAKLWKENYAPFIRKQRIIEKQNQRLKQPTSNVG